MAKARVIIKRRRAVRNIRKITKVMQTIATSRYQKAYRRALGTKPYVRKIGELVASAVQAVKASGRAVAHPLLREPSPQGNQPPRQKTAVLVISSNRGLCGGYNGSVLRLASQLLSALESAGDTPELHVSGKKGISYFRFQKRPLAQMLTAIGDNPKYAEIGRIADRFMTDYEAGTITGLKIVYMRFISAGQQRATVMDVMPLAGIAQAQIPTDALGRPVAATPYDFMPSAESLLAELVPMVVKITVFQAFVEAAVSEQIARMVAMKAATDNADKMGRRLTQDYNRARQSQITSELSELMGGVEALK